MLQECINSLEVLLVQASQQLLEQGQIPDTMNELGSTALVAPTEKN